MEAAQKALPVNKSSSEYRKPLAEYISLIVADLAHFCHKYKHNQIEVPFSLQQKHRASLSS